MVLEKKAEIQQISQCALKEQQQKKNKSLAALEGKCLYLVYIK